MHHCLPHARQVLAVCAHPDDESFGLGAVLATLAERGARVRELCFTSGEASTLGRTDRPLADVRAEELTAAAEVLGVDHVQLFSYPDGRLSQPPLDELTDHVLGALGEADLLLVFDDNGITGHPDHRRATEAALAAATASEIPVLAWALPQSVAERLNAEFGTGFSGRRSAELDLTIEVDRARQRAAIGCHATQSDDNPVLWRRLDLLGNREHLRWLHRPPANHRDDRPCEDSQERVTR
nr:PIG-L deacetylase family protein [Nocardia vaccinii]